MFKRLLKNFSETERSWILYDVANSAYTLTIVTVFFPIMLKLIGAEQLGYDLSIKEDNDFIQRYFTSIIQYATSIYALIVAILAPILGNLADYKGMKKRFFRSFLLIGLVFGVLLCIPNVPWQVYLIIYMIATIGYAGANVFYDSFLTDVTDEDRYDYVSSSGFAWGYIGSCVPFILGLVVYGLQMDGIELINLPEKWAIAIAFAIALIWWGLYSIPLLKNVEQRYYVEKPKNWLSKSFSDLIKTFKKLAREPKILLFLLGYFFYIDAVGTIIKSATNIGKALTDANGESIVGTMELLVILFIVQIIAFPFAIIFGLLAKKIGDVKMISFGILIYIVICTIGYFINEVWHIYVFAGLVGVAQGGIQAVSRSYFGKLIPKKHSGEFYGFFNIFGKFAAIMGPALLGFTVQVTGDAHYGTLSLIPLLIIGFILLLLASKSKPTSAELSRQTALSE